MTSSEPGPDSRSSAFAPVRAAMRLLQRGRSRVGIALERHPRDRRARRRRGCALDAAAGASFASRRTRDARRDRRDVRRDLGELRTEERAQQRRFIVCTRKSPASPRSVVEAVLGRLARLVVRVRPSASRSRSAISMMRRSTRPNTLDAGKRPRASRSPAGTPVRTSMPCADRRRPRRGGTARRRSRRRRRRAARGAAGSRAG